MAVSSTSVGAVRPEAPHFWPERRRPNNLRGRTAQARAAATRDRGPYGEGTGTEMRWGEAFLEAENWQNV